MIAVAAPGFLGHLPSISDLSVNNLYSYKVKMERITVFMRNREAAF